MRCIEMHLDVNCHFANTINSNMRCIEMNLAKAGKASDPDKQ